MKDVLGFYGKEFYKAARKTLPNKKGLLCIEQALERFLKYLCGREFLLPTDDAALAFIYKKFKNIWQYDLTVFKNRNSKYNIGSGVFMVTLTDYLDDHVHVYTAEKVEKQN